MFINSYLSIYLSTYLSIYLTNLSYPILSIYLSVVRVCVCGVISSFTTQLAPSQGRAVICHLGQGSSRLWRGICAR